MSELPPMILANAPKPGDQVRAERVSVEWIEARQGESDSALRRFRMVAYTGGPMRVGFSRPVVLDLRGLRGIDKPRPILRDHRRDQIVGHTTSITVVGANLVIEGVISGASALSREVVESSRNGFPWQASVGVQPLRVDEVAQGATVEVNGKQVAGPAYVVREGVLFESSFVALGADDDTSVALAHAHTGDPTMEQFKKWLKAKGFEYDNLTAEAIAFLQAKFDAEQAAANSGGAGSGASGASGTVNASNATGATGAATGAQSDAAIAGAITASNGQGGSPLTLEAVQQVLAQNNANVLAEAQHIAEVNALAANHPEIRAQAVSERWDLNRVRDAVELANVRASRSFRLAPGGMGGGFTGDSGTGLPASTGQSGRPNPVAVLTASLCMAGGIGMQAVAASAQNPDGFDQNTINAAMSREHRGATLSQLIYATIEAAGGYVRPGRIDDDTIRAALHADSQLAAQSAFIRASSGFSTLSLSGVLSNVANKQLLQSFLAVDMASSQFCGVGDNVDFKTTTRYRLTGVGVLEEVGPTGEIKHTSLDEDGFPSRVKTHAKMVTLTRVMMINDDLGAFLQLPAILGRQAALALEYAVFRLLISNPSNFFSVGNKNLLSGAGSVLGIDGLTKARAAFRKQADKAGQPIMLRPSILLVPAALETYAEQLFTDTYVNETTSENAPKPASNPHKGKFRPVASPMLDANGFIPGGSDTAWYLFADPADVPAIRISYLRGQRRPVLQSAETDFATLGMQWRNVFDFGVDTEEPRAAQKNAGG